MTLYGSSMDTFDTQFSHITHMRLVIMSYLPGIVFDDPTLVSSPELDDDPCPLYSSVGGITGGVSGDTHSQEQLSDTLVGLNQVIADLDALLDHLDAGTVQGTADPLSGSNKTGRPNTGDGSDEDAFLPSYADTRYPSFIHLSTTSATSDGTGQGLTSATSDRNRSESDLGLDREVRNLTSNANTTQTSPAGRFLGARPRDNNPLRRSNAFRSPGDDMDVHLRQHRVVGSTADSNIDPVHDDGFSSMAGYDSDPHQPPVNQSHSFCPIVPLPLRRSYGCDNLPLCVVYPRPRPAARSGRSLVAISDAAAADPSLLISATVAASQPSLPMELPVDDPLSVNDGISQPPMDTESAGAVVPAADSPLHHTGPGGSEGGPGGAEGASASGWTQPLDGASGWTPTTETSGVTFGAVSGCTKTILYHIITYDILSYHIISYHIISYHTILYQIFIFCSRV